MSIAALNQVYTETRRLAIAGSALAPGDFRLKKLVEPLQTAGQKSPVFAKVAQAITDVVESTPATATPALLELSTLVSAVLYTQGQTGIEGDFEQIETENVQLPSAETSARVLKPLIDALTSTGSGRLEIIQDAHDRGAFADIRLVKLAVNAVDDVYPEIADYVADNVLPIYGTTITPLLRETFDLEGKSGHVRRLKLLHGLDSEGTEAIVNEVLESGSKELKVAALECLEGRADQLPLLLSQSTAKAKDVRRAALASIAAIDSPDVVETLQKALRGKDLDIAVGPASRNPNDGFVEFLIQQAEELFASLRQESDKKKQQTLLKRCYQWLGCLIGRTDNKTDRLLVELFEQRKQLLKFKGSPGGQDIVERIGLLLVINDSKAGQKRLVDEHESLHPELLELALLAAVRTKSPKFVFDQFSPYLLAGGQRQKSKTTDGEKHRVVVDLLNHLQSHLINPERQRLYFALRSSQFRDDVKYNEMLRFTGFKLSLKWIDRALEIHENALALSLAPPKHKAALKRCEALLKHELKKPLKDLDYTAFHYVSDMIRLEHPQVVEYFLEAFDRVAQVNSRHTPYYSLVRCIPRLPAAAIEPIEQRLPTLDENLIDAVVPYLEQLKAKFHG